MSKMDENKDQLMKWLCNGIVKAAQPLSSAWSQLLAMEFGLRQKDYREEQDDEISIAPQDVFIPINQDNKINLSEIITHVKLLLKCLG